ncbi:Amidase [Lysobacter dokdonensis DS-58]|uniref:Amidase n=1 Tax=Lysobacter dokdonensis DS-58 TaxID=1300345 RepID=A0A0A2X2L3_9GAMM|nr:amidase [Lysobacter dokdonensis]KGQ19474.1 Amidase [Lysobacter dokdonensis DS-58]
MRLALLALALLAATGCQPRDAAAPKTAPAPAKPGAPSASEVPAFAYDEADIAGLQQRMAGGGLTSHALTQAYLDRIAAIDKAGPTLNAVIELNPKALAEADALDAERKAGTLRGPMHGIPVLLKDNIDAVPMVNSGGSLALANNKPARDAFLVQRLRAAGAVILGKTNLSEWANFRSTRSTSGWSGRGGQTKNPYALDRNPCGSSSGTGTAIAANLAVVGVGTETDGSIICPASVAGLVGLKPTVGLVSRDGIIPISATQDTAGPMTRTVSDAAAMLSAMVGRDDGDAATGNSVGKAVFDYEKRLDANALQGLRIGILRKDMGWHPDVDAAMERVVATLKSAGATVVDADIPTRGKWDEAEFEVLLFEFKAGVENYLQKHDAGPKTLSQLMVFNSQNADKEMPYFGQEIFEKANAKGPLGDPAYLEAKAKARRLAGPEGIDAAMQAANVDVLIAPAMSPAWPTDLVLGDHFVGAGYGAAAVAGYPSLTVPMGESHGLPIGVVFVGPAWSEAKLLSVGYAYEQRSKLRRAPTFAPTVRLGKTALPSPTASTMPVWTSAEPATASTSALPPPAAPSTRK